MPLKGPQVSGYERTSMMTKSNQDWMKSDFFRRSLRSDPMFQSQLHRLLAAFDEDDYPPMPTYPPPPTPEEANFKIPGLSVIADPTIRGYRMSQRQKLTSASEPSLAHVKQAAEKKTGSFFIVNKPQSAPESDEGDHHGTSSDIEDAEREKKEAEREKKEAEKREDETRKRGEEEKREEERRALERKIEEELHRRDMQDPITPSESNTRFEDRIKRIEDIHTRAAHDHASPSSSDRSTNKSLTMSQSTSGIDKRQTNKFNSSDEKRESTVFAPPVQKKRELVRGDTKKMLMSRSLSLMTCAGCHQDINTEYLTAMNQHWHPDHFRCFGCDRPVAGEFYEMEGKPSCRSCLDKSSLCGHCSRPVLDQFFKTQGGTMIHPECYGPFTGKICGGCGQYLSMGRTISAMEKQYHPQCFNCSLCRNSLERSNTFFMHQGTAICSTCSVQISRSRSQSVANNNRTIYKSASERG
ncbi:hypothetical protein PROFUN_05593 [Planoprotostelium fungivorum]|uniref:LIM zinc-binding domain-containing protein n=1 Tax=Planoprotostelium fungivorum TaxID=1890364 RepID=A0A2P6N059_9EUKA|nr:hypothetical protein PROFUN_05593 [Planoprotostelium fungivorum]